MPEGRRGCGSPPAAAVGGCGRVWHLPGLGCFARAETGAVPASSGSTARERGVFSDVLELC